MGDGGDSNSSCIQRMFQVVEGKSGGERRRRGSKSSLFQRLRSMQEGRGMQEERSTQEGRSMQEEGRSMQEGKAELRRDQVEGERVGIMIITMILNIYLHHHHGHDQGEREEEDEDKSHRRSLVLRGGEAEQTRNVSR